MQAPYLYIDHLSENQGDLLLNEEQSKHAIQVLRMQKGDSVFLTDGKGRLGLASIIADHKKACKVHVAKIEFVPPAPPAVRIGISLLKNPGRFEWFLEKATEIGVGEIIPLLCERTTRAYFRQNRMQQVIISAVLQSRQAWMPVLQEPLPFERLGQIVSDKEQRWIAHCMPDDKLPLLNVRRGLSSFILIGPEGDFTSDEVHSARALGFVSVSLGPTRLRTETAGIVAASLLKMGE